MQELRAVSDVTNRGDHPGRRCDDRPGGRARRRGLSDAIRVTGLVLTKIDGDVRGGAALSIREVTGVPVKSSGTREKIDALEPFHPDRLAAPDPRGWGDVDDAGLASPGGLRRQSRRRRLQEKFHKGAFILDDMASSCAR